MRENIDYIKVVSAFAVQQVGATEGVRSYDEVERFILANEPLRFWGEI